MHKGFQVLGSRSGVQCIESRADRLIPVLGGTVRSWACGRLRLHTWMTDTNLGHDANQCPTVSTQTRSQEMYPTQDRVSPTSFQGLTPVTPRQRREMGWRVKDRGESKCPHVMCGIRRSLAPLWPFQCPHSTANCHVMRVPRGQGRGP